MWKKWKNRKKSELNFIQPKPKKPRSYRFFKIGFFVLLALHLGSLYVHYDYWIFRLLISQHYIFVDDLDTLYTQALGTENFRGHFRDFDRMVMAVVTERIREINNDRFTYLYSPTQRQISLANERQTAQLVYFEPLTESTVYLFVPNISGHTRRFIQENRTVIGQFDNLILDLRANSGGLLMDFHQIADLFVENGAILGYEETRLPFFTRQIRSRNAAYFDFDNIIILQNRNTASAAESLILALQDNLQNITTIGTTTTGKAIGQVTIPLTGGSAVRGTVLLISGPNGETIHNIGIAPNIEFDETETADILAYALNLLEDL
ncbi:MAG: S41 family peptidase [Defluviitaleaceae bacterium]|nr:S41 family peptidase [Defluviitaleaceae bacterium]